MPNYHRSEKQEILGAIDLGSNALRAIVVRKKNDEIEVLKNIREPLRLGEDVFSTGKISPEKMLRTEEAFINILHLFSDYSVTQAHAMATSAMRDANNSQELIQRIFDITGIEIEIIEGKKEASLVFEAVRGQLPLVGKTVLLMDIGGGSTELILVKNEKIVGIESFNVGTVRLLRYKNQDELEFRIRLQLLKMLRFINLHLKGDRPDLFIGTGGNLRRIGKIRKKILGKSTSQLALANEISHLKETIFSMSIEDRIRFLDLDQNKADVILPAIMLTHHLMDQLKMRKIFLPKVGLKEGIILSMLPKKPKTFLLKD